MSFITIMSWTKHQLGPKQQLKIIFLVLMH